MNGRKIDFNKRLVRAVEKHPNIYNHQMQEYSNRQFKQEAWKSIAAEMGLTVAQCKEKWRNLRICYTEYIRKYINDTPKQLNSRSYLTEVMKYLRPFIQTREDYYQTGAFEVDTCDLSTKISPKLEKPDEIEIISDAETNDDELMAMKIYSETIQKEELNITPVEEIQNTYNSMSTEVPEEVPNHTEIACTGNTVLVNSNPRHQFLMSILPDLEKMNDRQMRKFRSRVSTAIEEILED